MTQIAQQTLFIKWFDEISIKDDAAGIRNGKNGLK
jgi:hypothetical protein